MSTTILQIRKDHLPTTRWHERADEPLAPGQVRVRIDRFALTSNNITYAALADGQVRVRIAHFAYTSNNITYAAFGEGMNYWRFYPSGEEGWGVIPVWGFATVVESTHPEVPVGERVYGYLPMASHTVLTPVRVSAGGWADGAPHRAELHPVYNQLTRCATDPFYTPDTEDVQALRALVDALQRVAQRAADASIAEVAASIDPEPATVVAHLAGSLGLDVLAGRYTSGELAPDPSDEDVHGALKAWAATTAC